MKDVTFAFLTAEQLPALRHTFLHAFADYQVPVQMNEKQFSAKLKREGIAPSFCVAAFAANQIIGFILTGLGEWEGRPTAYNAGTGVVPAFRGRGLTQQLYRFLLPKLQESGVEQALLEVICDNAPALKSYERIGFRIARSLNSYRAFKENLLLQVAAPDKITITEASSPDWAVYTSFLDVMPSWQNMALAFKRSPDKKLLLEARDAQQQLAGFVAFFPENGAIVQLAVKPGMRRRGIGTYLLREAAQRTKVPALMLINVDAAGKEVTTYLEHRRFGCILAQYEMLLPL